MNDEWETPPELFDKLDEEFRFEVDLCANINNSKCGLFSSDVAAYADAITTHFPPEIPISTWMNPPYSRKNIDECMEAAWKIAQTGHTVVCLVRCDPSAKWFQNYVDDRATEVRMLKHRVKFVGAPSAYNFPCCVVVYQGGEEGVTNLTDYYLWSWKDD